jgi:hypothetical protein
VQLQQDVQGKLLWTVSILRKTQNLRVQLRVSNDDLKLRGSSSNASSSSMAAAAMGAAAAGAAAAGQHHVFKLLMQ